MSVFRPPPIQREFAFQRGDSIFVDHQWAQWLLDFTRVLDALTGVVTTGTGATVLQNTPTINTPVIGGTISTNDVAALVRTLAAMNNGAAAAVGTLNNAPVAGNPTKWVPFDDNGTIRYIPTW